MSAFPWSELGLEPGSDAGAIRRAYAVRLKAMDPDADPDAYARLRQARDMALRQAKAAPAPAPVAGEPAGDAAVAMSQPWPLAGERYLCAGEGDLRVALAKEAGPCRPLARGAAADSLPAVAGGPGWPFFTPVLAVTELAAPAVQRADRRLHALLLGGGEDMLPMEEGEEEEARACLRQLLGDAATGSLARRDAVETWLADVLARSWPRCAPLLEEAAVAMGWQEHAGELGETPQVAFLTRRLAGYQFQRDVQTPGHPHAAAWRELNREGEAGLLRRLTFRPKRISALLRHLRKEHPELEQTLDHTRVRSWVKPGKSGWSIGWISIGLVAALRILALLSHVEGTTAPADPVPDPQVEAQLARVVSATFGQGHSSDWLKSRQPELARTLAANIELKAQSMQTAHSDEEMARDLVRTRSYFAARQAGGAELDQAMRQRLAVMDALGKDARACGAFMRSGEVPPGTVLPADMREAAQRLYAAQAEGSRLEVPAPSSSHSARVPAVLVGKVIDETGLKEARLATAMQGKGGDQDRCAVARALLRATLAWKGKEHEAILMTL